MNKLTVSLLIHLILNLLFLTSATAFQNKEKVHSTTDRPNILLIIADDLGYADMSFLSHAASDVHTPNIDRIAGKGVYFSNAYSTSPICSPSRAGLISGMYQARWGNYWYGEGGLPDSVVTLPQQLRKRGYITKKIGKTHLNGGPVEHPLDHGFDSFLGFIDHTWDYLRLSQKDVEEYGPKNARRAHIGPLMRNHEKVSYENDFTTDIFSREAVDFIKSTKANPFYLHLSYNAVHHPTYVGHPDYLDKFGIQQFPFWNPSEESYQEWHLKWGHLGKIDPNGRKRYLLQLTVMDNGIGRILGALEQTGQDSNTCIIFMSDNGGTINTYSNNAPLDGYKYMFGEGGIRVPLVISCPEQVTERQISSVVSAMDIYPTVLDLAGEEVPNNLDGKSLLPLLGGSKEYKPHDFLIWSNGRDSWVVRKGPWKLTHNIGWSHSSFVIKNGKAKWAPGRYQYPGGIKLYNLSEDIGEDHDLSKKHPDLVNELTRIYRQWRSRMSDPRRGDGTLKPKPDVGDRLDWGMEDLAENAYSNSSDISHYANLAIDGYTGTHWHSVTGNTAFQLPHHLIIKLKNAVKIKGFRYLPNQTSSKGRIKEYTFFVSKDGEEWVQVDSGSWNDDAESKLVHFSKVVEAKFLRLEAHSVHTGEKVASIAELGLIR